MNMGCLRTSVMSKVVSQTDKRQLESDGHQGSKRTARRRDCIPGSSGDDP